MVRIVHSEIEASPGFIAAGFIAALFVAGGLASAWYMEHYGHIVTGMSNRIVWGMPHVFAVFLIVAASGALNVASMSSVFGRRLYKPYARLSGLLAIALLVGGLAVLVLDLGRPDRLIVAMTSYNFRSIFAWNIFLYTGFLVIVGAYLVVQMGRRMGRFAPAAGALAFVWRLVLTTGTGSIFGWLVAREAYGAAVMAPLFIAMSLAFGHAIFILVLVALGAGRREGEDAILIDRLGRLLGLFVAAVLYFTAIQHLTALYAPGRHGVERFLLVDGGVHTVLFWLVQIVLGGLVPLALVFLARRGRASVGAASALVVLGGLAQVYVIIIAGQAYPLTLFPGMAVSSVIGDGAVATYVPSLPEIGLGLGGLGIAALVTLVGLKVLRFAPVAPAGSSEQAA